MSQMQNQYIQTSADMGDDVQHYHLVENNPPLDNFTYFGPMSSVNIFVGANSSGKSRFLRALFKTPSYRFCSEKDIEVILTVYKSCQILCETKESFSYHMDVKGDPAVIESRELVYQFPHLNLLPAWAGEVLKTYANIKFSEHYNSSYFKEVAKHLPDVICLLLGDRSSIAQGEIVDELQKISGVNVRLAVTATELLEGEKIALEADGDKESGSYLDFESLAKRQLRVSIKEFGFDFTNVSDQFHAAFTSFWNGLDYLAKQHLEVEIPPERIYIPTLRTAISLRNEGKKQEKDLFRETVVYNYGFSQEEIDDRKIDIFTGILLYENVHHDSNGKSQNRKRFEEFENFLSQTFFEQRKVRIVALSERDSPGKHIEIAVEGEEARDLHDLGDGIGALIILMYRIFLAKPGSWVFIEEPELNLHPGLQRIFLDTLVKNPDLQKRKLRVFMTTHSNHLLSITLTKSREQEEGLGASKIAIFSFQKIKEKEEFEIRALLSGQQHALALLGVSNSSVLLAQCGIWVEGATDRMYLRAYLKAYIDHLNASGISEVFTPREDLDFAFWEYAGTNLAHYMFHGEVSDRALTFIQSSSLCNRIFLLADRDEKVKARHDQLTGIQNNNFCFRVTPGVEVENLIGARLLRDCLESVFPKKPTAIPVVDYKESDYRARPLGQFLREKYPEHCPEAINTLKKAKKKSGSGKAVATETISKIGNDDGRTSTISNNYKVLLADAVASKVNWGNMSSDAKKLTIDLYNFIKKHVEQSVSA